MFNKKEWVKSNLKSGFDKGLWTAEHIMENAMKYSMAGVLDDNDLAELAAYTEPVVVEPEIIEPEMTEEATVPEENSATETEVE